MTSVGVNERLRALRKATGMGACAFARSIGMSPPDYCLYEALGRSPIDSRSGRWCATARRVAAALGVRPADVFPVAARERRAAKAGRRRHAEEVVRLRAPTSAPSPLTLLLEHEADLELHGALATLTERERLVLSHRFGLEDGHARTLAEVAAAIGVSDARVRQIEAGALRLLGLPSRGLW